MVPKDRAGPWLVLVVSVAVGALVAAVEGNDPKFRTGTSSIRKRKRQTFYYRHTVVSADRSNSQVRSNKKNINIQCNKYSTLSRKLTRPNEVITYKAFQG